MGNNRSRRPNNRRSRSPSPRVTTTIESDDQQLQPDTFTLPEMATVFGFLGFSYYLQKDGACQSFAIYHNFKTFLDCVLMGLSVFSVLAQSCVFITLVNVLPQRRLSRPEIRSLLWFVVINSAYHFFTGLLHSYLELKETETEMAPNITSN